ncbi:MAG: YkvA family protein [Bacteroidota bacterium]
MQVSEDFDVRDSPTMDPQYSYVTDNFDGKVRFFGRRIPFLEDAVALYRYMTDSHVAWYNKGLVIAALAYFIAPLDAIPDFAPFVGFLDDLGVIALVVRHLGRQLKPFYR